MKTLRKIPPFQLTLVLVLVIGLGAAALFRYVARAQDGGISLWADTGIGATGAVQEDASGVFTVANTGRDIWGQTDSFHFVYQPLAGNGEIVARVLAIGGTNAMAKAGVMIRETLNVDSRNAMTVVTMGRGAFFQWRTVAGGDTDRTTGNSSVLTPHWVKVVRSGDWIGGYTSTDGADWTLAGWQVLKDLSQQVYVGLAMTSHDANGTSSMVGFDQVSVEAVKFADVLNPFVGTGDGLKGSYFPNRHLFGKPAMSRVDGTLNCNFQLGREQFADEQSYKNQCLAVLGIPKSNEYSIRWTGELQAQFSEPYTLVTKADDGVRVCLNDQLIIDNWVNHDRKEAFATVNLVAGQKYLLRVEYFQNHGNSKVTLSWSSPSTPKQVIPQSQLYSQPTDADGNGLPDMWELHFFQGMGMDPNADQDNDGLSNLQEWRQHSDPTSPLNWGVPNEWTHGDIESGDKSDASEGNADYNNGVYTVSSTGRCIWLREDNFHYLYQPIGTNGEMIVRLTGLDGVNPQAKAGLMLRATLDNDSRNVFLAVEQDNLLLLQCRNWEAENTARTQWQTNQSMARWLKLVRNNDWIGGYISTNGTQWELLGWEVLKHLPARAFIGMAVTAQSHKGTRSPTVAQFDHVNAGTAPIDDILDVAEGDGDGLMGNYRSDSLLYLSGVTNFVDEQIYFDWIHYPPFKQLDPDSYGVCWSGEVQAQVTEPYTFSLQCRQEDWVRLWVNEQLVVDGWRTVHPDTIFKGKINLTAGSNYLIRVEMFNNHGRGMARLKWKSPSTPNHVVPQNQLYSQPADVDGNGLPDLWEQIYFGRTGVNPGADPDGDGLSNFQEYQYHTSPTKEDTDNDGLPDAWEIAHGLDPQFNDAGLDYVGNGWSNLQKYLYGLDPVNSDVNGDGLPDNFEVGYLGVDVKTSHTNLISVEVKIDGAQATNYLGNWLVDGSDIYALDRRGGLDFVLPVAKADKYVLNLVGAQNRPNSPVTAFKLMLGIDGQKLGHYTLNAGNGTNGRVELVLPYLQSGTHTLNVFWDGVSGRSSLRIKQIKLLAVEGADANQNGIKDWADKMITDESGMDLTNAMLSSYTSPVCLEGRDLYPSMFTLTNDLADALTPMATTDGRWYVNAPLRPGTQTVFQASFQNGAVVQTRQVQWQLINLLTGPGNMTIRKGDSLWLTALPDGAANGNLEISYDTNVFSGKAAKGMACKFTNPGAFTVKATYNASSGAAQSGSFTVNVVQQKLPNEKPAAWTWNARNLNLPSLAPESVLQFDSRLTCSVAGTIVSGGIKLTLGTDDNEERTILARLGADGPVLDSTRVSGFDLWSGSQAYLKIIQVYPDGSQLVEMMMISSPMEPNVTFVLEPIVSGVIFDDGTTVKALTASDFDALGQCTVRFIRPASVHTSVCHQIKAYQGNNQIGYRH